MKQTLLLIALVAFAACAPVQDETSAHDPIEPFNRQVFAFNEAVDQTVLQPIARGYRAVTPTYARKGVRNALRNFGEPVNMVNSLLQGDVTQFFTSGWRMVLNTTLGFGGVYDFAGTYGNLPYRQEDFGQTLAVWAGNDDSAYLVVPLLGPSTTRDIFGRVVDVFTNPWTYALETEENLAIAGVEALAAREASLDLIDDIYETSFDPYSSIRSGYLQRRKALIENRNSSKQQPFSPTRF